MAWVPLSPPALPPFQHTITLFALCATQPIKFIKQQLAHVFSLNTNIAMQMKVQTFYYSWPNHHHYSSVLLHAK